MKLLKNFSLYSLGRMLVDGLRFFLIPLYTAYIPIAEYGLYNILVSIKEILFNFFSQVSEASYSRFFFKDKNDKQFFSNIVSIFLLSFAILTIITLLLSNTIKQILFSNFPHFFYLIYILLGISFAQFFVQIKMSEFIMESKALKYFITSLVVGIAPIVLIIFMVLRLDMTIDALLVGMFIPYSLLTLYILLRKRNEIFKKPNIKLIKKYNSYGLPLTMNTLSSKVLNAGDRFVIQYFLTSAAVGAYSFIYLITSTLLIFVTQPFIQVVNPLVMRYEDNQKTLQKTVTNASVALLIGLSIFGLLLSFFVEYILNIVIKNQDYMQYVSLISLLSIAFVIDAGRTFTNRGLVFKNKTHIIMWVSVSTAILNIILNIILIPIMGIWGAALATVLAFLFSLPLLIYYSEKHHPLRYPKARIYTIIVTYSGIIGLYYLFQNTINNIVLKIGLIVLYLTLLWIFRILTKANIKYAIKTIRKS